MNKKLQKSLSDLESLILVQKNCVIAGQPEADYMHGMLNGMILAHSMFADCDPKFHSKPSKRRRISIRHKSNIRKNKNNQ